MQKLLITVIIVLGALVNTKAPIANKEQCISRREVIEESRQTILTSERLVEIRQSEFSPEILREYLELRNVRSYKIVLAQFRLETGHFKSRSFKVYNNISGMKRPRIRPNLASGEALGHAYYSHWTTSVDDYILWQEYNAEKLAASNDYYEFLSSVGYAEDGNYQKILKQIRIV